jgi:serine/threonine-protein kinase
LALLTGGPDVADVIGRLNESLAGQYVIERELGSGGMARVYLAQDLRHGRRVAVKVLKDDVAAAVGSERFLREIQIAAGLTHPHILPLHDSGAASGFLYYVMPYVDGESLRQRLDRERQLTVEDATRIASEVADALGYAHSHNIVHRDIKPENILLEAGHAVVSDFGIARAIMRADSDETTSTGIAIGTPRYMSPEQGTGDPILDARSDIYSLGCTLYETLTGEPPFGGRTAQAIIARHAAEAPPSMRVVRPEIPAELETVVRKALAKVPADRYPSAEAFSKALSGHSLVEGLLLTLVRSLAGRKRQVALALGVIVPVAAVMIWIDRGSLLRRHDWVVIADFQGPTDDPTLPMAVRDLTTDEMNQSRFVRTLTRRQLNSAMRHASVPETTFVDAELAQQLAFRRSVRAVIVGNVQRLGGSNYSIALHAVNATDGTDLQSVAGAATEENLVTTVQNLARELLQQLGERRSEIEANRPLRDVATPSFEAYRKYSEALNVVAGGGDLVAGNDLFADAIAIDSSFASAWAAMGTNYLSARQPDSARHAFSRALAFPHRLTDASRYRLEGDVAYAIHHDLAGAVRWYDLYLQEVPHSRSGRSNRAVYLSALGRYDEAVSDLREAVEANPFGAELAQATMLNLAAALVVVGRIEEAQEVAEDITDPFAHYVAILVALARSDWSGVDSLGSSVATGSRVPTFLRIHARTSQASALAARGAVSAADSLLEAAAEESSGGEARWYQRARLLLRIVSDGEIAQGWFPVSEADRATTRTLRALWAAAAGDSTGARREIGDPSIWQFRDSAAVGNGPELVEALVSAHASEWRDVVDRLGPAAWQGEHDPALLDRPSSLMMRWLVGDAYDQLGWPDSAAAYFERITEPSDMPPAHFALRGLTFSFAHRRLALLYGQLGDTNTAVDHWNAFLRAVVRPDSVTLQLVRDARRELAQLSPGR